MEMHSATAWNQRGIAVPRPYRERGKKLKVTRAGMNKWADLCNRSRHEDYHIVLSSKYLEKFNQGHIGGGGTTHYYSLSEWNMS